MSHLAFCIHTPYAQFDILRMYVNCQWTERVHLKILISTNAPFGLFPVYNLRQAVSNGRLTQVITLHSCGATDGKFCSEPD